MRRLRAALIVSLIAACSFGIAVDAQAGASTATVQTDKSDYSPGTTVHFTGTGWMAGEVVTVHFVESSTHPGATLDTHPDLYATADANGNIQNHQFQPDVHDVN